MSLIIITGMSGSGKSTIVDRIKTKLETKGSCVALSQDDFFAAKFVPYAESLRKGCSEIEGPRHINFEALVQKIQVLLPNTDFVLLEGHALLCCNLLVQMATQIIYLEVTPTLCKRRRLYRRKRSESELKILAEYFDQFVISAHKQNVSPILEKLGDQIVRVDGEKDLELVVQKVNEIIQMKTL